MVGEVEKSSVSATLHPTVLSDPWSAVFMCSSHRISTRFDSAESHIASGHRDDDAKVPGLSRALFVRSAEDSGGLGGPVVVEDPED